MSASPPSDGSGGGAGGAGGGAPAPQVAEESPFGVARPSGRVLAGTLTAPPPACAGAPAPRPFAVVLLHGLLSHRDNNFFPALAARLAASLRVHVLRIDLRGPPRAAAAAAAAEATAAAATAAPAVAADAAAFGAAASPSAHEPAHRFRICGFADDADDALCAARALRRERGLETIGVLGHSRGASSALVLFGGGDDDVDGAARRELLPRAALAAVAPRFVVAGVLGKFSAEELARSAAGEAFSGPRTRPAPRRRARAAPPSP